MPSDLEQRAQDAVERLLEDESLTSDLTDTQAKPIIQWATNEAKRIALDEKNSDEAASASLRKLRAAIKFCSKNASGDLSANTLLGNIQQQLREPEKPNALSSENPLTSFIKELENMAQSNPTDDFFWLKLGDFHTKNQDIPKATDAYLKAAALYEQKNFPQKAIQLLKTILLIDPKHTEARAKLTRLQENAPQTDPASRKEGEE